MDIANPLRSAIPTVDADVLLVLARTHAPLTGARVSVVAGRSYSQVRDVLHRLVEHGVVDVQRHGNAFSYRLNRDHVSAPAIEQLAAAADTVEARLAGLVASWALSPHALAVFGSFARRDGDPSSDLDLLLVRAPGTDEDDEDWRQQRYELALNVERWTGNRAQIVELSVAELAAAVSRGDGLVAGLRTDGRVLSGPSLSELVAPRRRASA